MDKLLLSIGVMLFLFVGCNISDPYDRTLDYTIESNKEMTEKVEMKVMLPYSEDIRSNINDRVEKKLLETYPDVSFEFEYVNDYWDYLRSMNAMGNLPDIFFADTRELIIPLIESGSVLDLRPYIEEDGFINKYSINMTVTPHEDGGIYSVQSGADTYFCSTLFYNKTIFDQLELQVPRDMKAFYKACEILKDNDYIPLTTSMQDGWAIESLLIPQYIAGKDPNKILDIVEFKVNMADDPIILEALEMIRYLGDEAYLPNNLIRLSYGESQALFTEHKAGMYIMYSWAAGNLAGDPSFDVMPWPADQTSTDNTRFTTVWGSQYSGYLVSSSTNDSSLAVEMVELMALEEARFFNEDQKIPTSLYTGIEIEDQPYLVKEVLKQIDEADILLPSYKLFIFTSETIERHSDLLLKVYVGEMSNEEYSRQFGPVWEDNIKDLQINDD